MYLINSRQSIETRVNIKEIIRTLAIMLYNMCSHEINTRRPI